MLGNLGLNCLNDFTLALATTYRTLIVNSVKTADSLNAVNDEESLPFWCLDVWRFLMLENHCY